MESTHRGRRYRVERDEVVEEMMGEEPKEATQRHRYYVKIGDTHKFLYRPTISPFRGNIL